MNFNIDEYSNFCDNHDKNIDLIPSFVLFSENNKNKNKYFKNYNKIVSNNNSEMIKKIFFSEKNIKFILDTLSNKIKYFNSNNQDLNVILTFMNSIYENYYNILNNDLNKHINYLNKIVIDKLEVILNNKVYSQKKYLNDIKTLYTSKSFLPSKVDTKKNNLVNNDRIFNLYN